MPRRTSLAERWLDRTAHPVVALAVILALEAAATGGLVWKAGWSHILHAIAVDNFGWFGLCAAGQLVAYVGYALDLRAAAQVDRGVAIPLPASLAVVSVGFGPMFSANLSGGFSVDYVTLREAGMGRRRAFRRVLGLSALEYAVLAPAVAVCGVLLYFDIGGSASASLTLPWLLVVPGAIAAAWLTSPKRVERFEASTDASWIRRGFAHAVAALAVLRALVVGWRAYAWAFGGAALYWIGDVLTLWAALRVFGVHLSAAELVLAYGTGWALTRRSLPFGGPGVVEILLAFVLTWFHVPFASGAAGVVAYRLFNFWLALIPAAGVLPFSDRVERQIADAGAGDR
ncbi:MAG TPA: lysylphosphatidylglycerol synthase transmembrane domain-containing protein [Gaiellaceae bacterium]|nr:lysylphosphatidylglycerol synthase transmembrane domain-containing protein [Gaiellaceae bacterium]